MADEGDIFLSPDENRDFALLVEDTKVYVNREFLSCFSPVLRKIFYPEGAAFEQPEGGMEMKEKKLDEFLLFLRMVWPLATADPITEANVVSMLAYAEEYDVAVLRERCVAFMTRPLPPLNVDGAAPALVEYLRLALLYNLEGLQLKLIPLVAQLSIGKIQTAHETLPAEVLVAVYQAKALHQAAALESLQPRKQFLCGRCNKVCAISSTGIHSSSSCCNYSAYKCVYEPTPNPNLSALSETFWRVNRPAQKCSECSKNEDAFECTCRYTDFSADLLLKKQ